MKQNFIIPSAEPFYYQGNKIGCLLIHGFTGTPKEMRLMGEYLANQGYTRFRHPAGRARHKTIRYEQDSLVGLDGVS